MGYFCGYLLDVNEWELTGEDKILLQTCAWLVDNKSTIRVAAVNNDMAKSTLHVKIHNRLRYISFELYKLVVKQLKINLDRARRLIK